MVRQLELVGMPARESGLYSNRSAPVGPQTAREIIMVAEDRILALPEHDDRVSEARALADMARDLFVSVLFDTALADDDEALSA